MFRRRTDRVYSTLQNVQRRITQGTVHDGHTPQTPSVSSVSPIGEAPPEGTASSVPDSRGGTVFEVPAEGTNAPLIQPVSGAYSEAPVIGEAGLVGAPQVVAPQPTIQAVPSGASAPLLDDTSESQVAPSAPEQPAVAPAPVEPNIESAQVANPALQMARQEGRGTRLMLSTEVALLLTVAWLLTCAVFFAIGWRLGIGAGETPFEGLGPIDQQSGTSGQLVEPAQSDILVLAGSSELNDAIRARYVEEAERLNRIAGEQERFEPWFAVRFPQSGGIQLVFGQRDGRFGVDRNHPVSTAVFQTMQTSSYRDAFWYDLSPSP